MPWKINLNTADKDELRQISGVGEKMADALLRYRDEHGKFKSKEEIDEVPGFSNIRTEKVKNNTEL